MKDDTLAENEFRLISEIARDENHTQRSLSRSVGLSLGTTNLLIQRLARKGLIKINQFDWKRMRYLLTLKGAVEKSDKIYHYTLYTIRLFRQIQNNINTVLLREHQGGRRRFHLVAQEELLELLKDSARDLALDGAEFSYYASFKDLPADADLVLTATHEAPPPKPGRRRYQSVVNFDNINLRIG